MSERRSCLTTCSLKTFSSLWKNSEKVRFLVIGGINTLVGYLIFASLYYLLSVWLHYLLIALLGHAMAVCFSFILQRKLVFKSIEHWWPEFIRFNISLMAVFIGGLSGLYLCVSILGVHPLLAQALITGFSAIASYIAHRYFSFRPRQEIEG